MVTCKHCGAMMVGVLSFSKNKREKFNTCARCHSETKHQKVNDEDLDFGELLHKEICNRNHK